MASTPKSPLIGRALPDIVKAALVEAVEKAGTQTAVAKRLGISTAAVSQALNDKYIGDVKTLADRIRGELIGETVQCPVMHTLTRRHCLDYQVRPLVFTNPMRVALFRACKTCPNRKDKEI